LVAIFQHDVSKIEISTLAVIVRLSEFLTVLTYNNVILINENGKR